MRIRSLQRQLSLLFFLVAAFACQRKTYNAHEYRAPLSTPEPLPEGQYSTPAAATPERVAPVNQGRVTNGSDGTAGADLPQGNFHCPPASVTPPSAPVVDEQRGLSAIDCPPGDPNAASTRTGQAGTPAASGVSTDTKPATQPGDGENRAKP